MDYIAAYINKQPLNYAYEAAISMMMLVEPMYSLYLCLIVLWAMNWVELNW